MNVLVVAPHPDDEILGCGGTIARLIAEQHSVYVVILTKGGPPLFTEEFVKQGRENALKAHQFLGVTETFFADFPAAGLDKIAHSEINRFLVDIINKINPDMLFIPFNSDLHLDHQYTFLSALVAARPNQLRYPKAIYAYETLSETHWNAPYLTSAFQPNVFFDISNFLDKKITAFSMHDNQVKAFPHERSIETLRALATLRGSNVYKTAAEAFVLIREVI